MIHSRDGIRVTFRNGQAGVAELLAHGTGLRADILSDADGTGFGAGAWWRG